MINTNTHIHLDCLFGLHKAGLFTLGVNGKHWNALGWENYVMNRSQSLDLWLPPHPSAPHWSLEDDSSSLVYGGGIIPSSWRLAAATEPSICRADWVMALITDLPPFLQFFTCEGRNVSGWKNENRDALRKNCLNVNEHISGNFSLLVLNLSVRE